MKKFSNKFIELENESVIVRNTKHYGQGQFSSGLEYIDRNIFQKWNMKVKNLLILCCGEESIQYKEFLKVEKSTGFTTNIDIFDKQCAILSATKEDYEDGFLTSIRSLVQAEVFESELEQASELLDSGYYAASAVIAGIVLETGLRTLCDRESIENGKLDKMNADLAKKGIYNKLQQKRITALADIRNSAAHGKNDEFSSDDVKRMIVEVELFLATFLV